MYLDFVQAGEGSQLPDPVEQFLAWLDGEGGEHTFPAQHPGLRNRIRIGSGFNRVSGSGSGSKRAKMTHKSSEKSFKSSCFEVLDGLFRELKASSVT